MDNTRKNLLGSTNNIDLEIVLKASLKPENGSLYKCRIIYDKKIESIEFVPYHCPNITSLKLVQCDNIDYHFKFLDRNSIIELYRQKGGADDIIIVKKGLITDSSTANLLFFDGRNWITPSKPLLKGTQRAKLIEECKIQTGDITNDDLLTYKKIRLINAMLKFEDEVDIDITNIS